MKKTFAALFVIFFFMLILNIMKPLSSDDFFLAFVWPEGMPINVLLPEGSSKISSISDFCKSIKTYYFVWGGRVTGQSLMTFFAWQGKEYFNFFNAFMVILLIAEIYWLSHEGKVSLDFDLSYIIWIFFSLWSFNISFNDTFLWLSGACEYLWTLVIILAFLIPYVRNYYDNRFFTNNSFKFAILMFFGGLLSGTTRETVICWVIVVLSFWLYICFRKSNLQLWKISGFAGLCIGYAVLIFAPGNVSRLAIQQKADSFLLPPEFLLPKLTETLGIVAFHLFLWYFLLTFFLRFSNKSKLEVDSLHINIAKACTFIAFCSGMVMFMIQSEGFRPSFVNLVFLTIAVASIFRFGETTDIQIIDSKTKSFLKKVGYVYLSITIIVSFYGNYLNWMHWNSILALVKDAQNKQSDVVVEINPYPIGKDSMVYLLSGFHIIMMPFNNEYIDESINNTFAKYYGIQGIKKVK